MKAFEAIMLALLATAAKDAPIFVHSTQGIAILNTSTDFLGAVIQQFATPAPVKTA